MQNLIAQLQMDLIFITHFSSFQSTTNKDIEYITEVYYSAKYL